jgi:hypothetical protein
VIVPSKKSLAETDRAVADANERAALTEYNDVLAAIDAVEKRNK